MASSSEPLDANEKLHHFREVTGITDVPQCHQILEAHGWNLEQAVQTILASRQSDGPEFSPFSRDSTGAGPSDYPAANDSNTDLNRDSNPAGVRDALLSGDGLRVRSHAVSSSTLANSENSTRGPSSNSSIRTPPPENEHRQSPPSFFRSPGSFVSKLVKLPGALARRSFSIALRALGVGLWAVSGVFYFSFASVSGLVGWLCNRIFFLQRPEYRRIGPPPPADWSAAEFLNSFESVYGTCHPTFHAGSFLEAVRVAASRFKFLFVYVHSPEHVDTEVFCRNTMCTEVLRDYLDESFVCWAADVRSSEGYRTSLALRATRYPFCALVTSSSLTASTSIAAAPQALTLLLKLEGPFTVEHMMERLHTTLDRHGALLVAARVDEEERSMNRRLREEQDAEYQASLLADQERERERQQVAAEQQKVEAERQERERAEEERQARDAQEAAERQALLERKREEGRAALREEPAKGPGVTQILIRMPTGERKERRFHSGDKVRMLFHFVDSTAILSHPCRSLATSFPRRVFGQSEAELTLEEAGLCPQALLLVEA